MQKAAVAHLKKKYRMLKNTFSFKEKKTLSIDSVFEVIFFFSPVDILCFAEAVHFQVPCHLCKCDTSP